MTAYPVHYHVPRPARFTRLQLLVRAIAFIAFGVVGVSFGTVLVFAYLALPVFAASRLTSRPGAYLTEDGPRIVRVFRWYAAVCAWAGLLTDRLPGKSPDETVSLEVEPGAGHPNPRSAILRVLTGVPSAVALALLCWVGALVWLWAALSILVTRRVGPGAFAYLVGLQRWSVRLLAYQASLVDRYPPFSLADAPPVTLPPAQVAP